MTPDKKIAIFIPCYDAESTIARTIERIPADVKQRVAEIFVVDDCSHDQTYQAALAYQQAHPNLRLSVFRNERNLGYGGNQKHGYTYALSKGYDIVVMLHGDGQYPPERLPDLLQPLENGQTDAVYGSRMMRKPLEEGMPFIKFIGNFVLSRLMNLILNNHLHEYHSGYRLYSCNALRQIPFLLNSDEFHFDTDIIVQFKEKGLRIVEIPIIKDYGDCISRVQPFKYVSNVLKSVVAYRLHKLGLLHYPQFDMRNAGTTKKS